MTVKELRDRLDNYIKTDPPDLWQLNDCELDALYYKERCEERGNKRVAVLMEKTIESDMHYSSLIDIKSAYASTVKDDAANEREEIFELTV